MEIPSPAPSAPSGLKAGTVVRLRELHPSSPFFDPSGSYRVTGRLQSYDLESDMALISEEGGATLRVGVEHIRDLHLRSGSLFQFIGEISIPPNQQMYLQARVGRNVDGLDIKLYGEALELRRKFEAKYSSHTQG